MKFVTGIVVMLAVLAGVVMVNAQKPAAPKTVELTGVVVVATDDAGAVSAASLKTGEGESVKLVAISLDKNGLALVEAAGQNTVKVAGEMAEIDGAEMLVVKKFAVVTE